MPDFNVQNYWHCESARKWKTKIGDYTVSYGPSKGEFQYDYKCACKGYEFRKTCKHIKEAQKIHCNWNQFVSGEAVEDGNLCPNCGEKAFSAPYSV